MIKISAVVSAYNEEQQIEKCLSSLRFCDEIILVDNQSTDNTAEIARKFGCRVFFRPNNKMLNINKNFGFSKAKNEWVLNLDADEAVSEELKTGIGKINGDTKYCAYQFPRRNIIFGKWIKHSLWWPDYQIRLFRKSKGKFLCLHIHELLEIDGEIGTMEGCLTHHNYRSVSQYLRKLDQIYTDSEVDSLVLRGKKLVWYDVLRMPANDFFKTFFLQKGYRDGLHGLVLSLLQSFYSLVIFAKYWERKNFQIDEPSDMRGGFTKEIVKIHQDLTYWLNTSEIEESSSLMKKLVLKVKRRIGI